MRMTKHADYGIILMTQLAHGGLYTAPQLATQTRVPLSIVTKILKRLVRTGLLVSHRGVKGGYSLARPPELVTIAEVITALEGPIALTECIDSPGTCDLESSCPMRSPWQRINAVVHRALDLLTLKELTLAL